MTTIAQRLNLLAEELVGPVPAGVSVTTRWLGEHVGDPRHDASYLMLAVLTAQIPAPELIKGFTRDWRLDGLKPLLDGIVRRSRWADRTPLPIRVVREVVVDVTDTVASRFTTGIQRVARETVARWWHDPARAVTLVRWDARGRRLISLDAEQVALVVPKAGDVVVGRPAIVVPYHATFLLPEIAVSPTRASRLRTIGRFAAGRALAIGFDCIPITSAETAGTGMPGAFSKYLSALARFDAIAPISDAAATEYRGWRRMLSGAGLRGPEIEAVSLPFATSGVSEPSRAGALRTQLGLDDVPIVVCVGSHEPRKNHLTVLHACEIAWREGREFALVLVGGNSWDTENFDRLVAQLRRRDRRVLTLSGVGDDVIWDLYDLASFSIFTSLNEGFGLPVVESISHGTPVITSDFGSMRTLGAGHGGLLVDPRDPQALAESIGRLLDDPSERERLSIETRTAPTTTWDDYASQIWRLARPDAD
jgi:glycosyltransferase involved in cell wall biosynthesis